MASALTAGSRGLSCRPTTVWPPCSSRPMYSPATGTKFPTESCGARTARRTSDGSGVYVLVDVGNQQALIEGSQQKVVRAQVHRHLAQMLRDAYSNDRRIGAQRLPAHFQ